MKTLSTWISLQLIYSEAIRILETMFADAGFCFMPLKGAYLIRTGLAETIPDRKMVDIDILIPRDQFDTVCQWFGSQKDIISRDNYWDFERSFVITVCNHPVYIEFHRLLNFEARYLLPNEDLFRRGMPVSKACTLPDPVDSLLIHICHKLAHVIDGFEFQFYNEITLLSSQKGFDWDEFWKRAKKTGILGFIWLVIHKWKRKNRVEISIPKAPSLYVGFIAKFGLFMKGNNANIRRLFFEVPFTKNKLSLFLYKARRSK